VQNKAEGMNTKTNLNTYLFCPDSPDENYDLIDKFLMRNKTPIDCYITAKRETDRLKVASR